SPDINDFTANRDFVEAVRHALDYDRILDLIGEGAERPGSVVPSGYLGTLPTENGNQYDPGAAQAALERSGYSGEPITLGYPSDLQVGGMLLDDIALMVQ